MNTCRCEAPSFAHLMTCMIYKWLPPVLLVKSVSGNISRRDSGEHSVMLERPRGWNGSRHEASGRMHGWLFGWVWWTQQSLPRLTGPCERFMLLNVKSSLLFAALAGCYLRSSPLSLQADCECTPHKQRGVAMFDLIFWSIHLAVFKSDSNRKSFFFCEWKTLHILLHLFKYFNDIWFVLMV